MRPTARAGTSAASPDGDNYEIGVVRLADRRRSLLARSPAYDGSYAGSGSTVRPANRDGARVIQRDHRRGLAGR